MILLVSHFNLIITLKFIFQFSLEPIIQIVSKEYIVSACPRFMNGCSHPFPKLLRLWERHNLQSNSTELLPAFAGIPFISGAKNCRIFQILLMFMSLWHHDWGTHRRNFLFKGQHSGFYTKYLHGLLLVRTRPNIVQWLSPTQPCIQENLEVHFEPSTCENA